MVKIRLRRMGAKKAPFYRIVVADSRYPRDGRFIEEIGYYNPMEEPSVVKVDPEKAKAWMEKGAQPTDTVKAVSYTHLSMKMNIVNLFKELKDKYKVSFIYITHDLSTAYYVSDYIATLYRGCLIEYGPAKEIMDEPAHPYTELLMSAVPRIGCLLYTSRCV